MPRAGRPGELRILLAQVQSYITELETRVAAGPAGKYNGFGSFLQQYLGFTDDTLRGWGIFSAQEKLVQAKHLKAAIHFNSNGTVTDEIDPVRQGDPAALEVLERGRLGKFAERLTAPEYGQYELMRQHRAAGESRLIELRALSLDSSIAALQAEIEILNQQLAATTSDKAIVAAASSRFNAAIEAIERINKNATVLFKTISRYYGEDANKLRIAIEKDTHVHEAHEKITSIGAYKKPIDALRSQFVKVHADLRQKEAAARRFFGGGGTAAAVATATPAAVPAPAPARVVAGAGGTSVTAPATEEERKATASSFIGKALTSIFGGKKKAATAPTAPPTAAGVGLSASAV